MKIKKGTDLYIGTSDASSPGRWKLKVAGSHRRSPGSWQSSWPKFLNELQLPPVFSRIKNFQSTRRSQTRIVVVRPAADRWRAHAICQLAPPPPPTKPEIRRHSFCCCLVFFRVIWLINEAKRSWQPFDNVIHYLFGQFYIITRK
jgi:hypothetical protein